MTPERVHLKERKGPVTDLRRKKALALHANLIASVRSPAPVKKEG